MTLLQDAKLRRNEAIIQFLTANEQVLLNDKELLHFYTKIKKDQVKALEARELVFKDAGFHNQEKTIAKKEAADLALELCARAKDKLNTLENRIHLKNIKGVGIHYFFRGEDTLIKKRLLDTHKALKVLLPLLQPVLLTEEHLEELMNKIILFANLPGSSYVNSQKSVEVGNIVKEKVKLTEIDARYIEKQAEVYRETNPPFYEGLLKACTLERVDE